MLAGVNQRRKKPRRPWQGFFRVPSLVKTGGCRASNRAAGELESGRILGEHSENSEQKHNSHAAAKLVRGDAQSANAILVY